MVYFNNAYLKLIQTIPLCHKCYRIHFITVFSITKLIVKWNIKLDAWNIVIHQIRNMIIYKNKY